MRFFNRCAKSDAAKSVADQAATARKIVGIEDQELLEDARTNPATRADADRLRTERHREQLKLDHRRSLRRDRVTDTRASAAERALDAITQAREATSPGQAVQTLTTTRSRYMFGCLAASILLSIGSGMGIEAHLMGLDGDRPAGQGYIVEAGLTVLSTAMIVARGILAARGTALATWQNIAFGLVIVPPLLGSVVLASMGSGLVGAFCSIGSVAWSLAAYLTTTSFSTAIGDALGDVNSADEDELRRIALDDTEEPESGRRPSGTEWVTEQTQTGLDEIAQFLADQNEGPDTGDTSAAHTDPTGDGPSPRQNGVPTRAEVEAAWHHQQVRNADQTEGHTVADQHERPAPEQRAEHGVSRTSPAIAARRATGQTNLHRVADHRQTHPDQTVEERAADLSLSPSTIKRHLRTLRQLNA